MKKNSLLLVALLSVVGCSKSIDTAARGAMGDGALANDLTQPASPPPAKAKPVAAPTVQRAGTNDDGIRPVGPKGAVPARTGKDDDSLRPTGPKVPAPLPTVARGGVIDDGVRPKGPAPAPVPTAR